MFQVHEKSKEQATKTSKSNKLNDSNRDYLRRWIYTSWEGGQIVTLDLMQQELKRRNINISKSSLHKEVKSMGFKYMV